jgi:hypothetical protein
VFVSYIYIFVVRVSVSQVTVIDGFPDEGNWCVDLEYRSNKAQVQGMRRVSEWERGPRWRWREGEWVEEPIQ